MWQVVSSLYCVCMCVCCVCVLCFNEVTLTQSTLLIDWSIDFYAINHGNTVAVFFHNAWACGNVIVRVDPWRSRSHTDMTVLRSPS